MSRIHSSCVLLGSRSAARCGAGQEQDGEHHEQEHGRKGQQAQPKPLPATSVQLGRAIRSGHRLPFAMAHTHGGYQDGLCIPTLGMLGKSYRERRQQLCAQRRRSRGRGLGRAGWKSGQFSRQYRGRGDPLLSGRRGGPYCPIALSQATYVATLTDGHGCAGATDQVPKRGSRAWVVFLQPRATFVRSNRWPAARRGSPLAASRPPTGEDAKPGVATQSG